MTWLELWTQTPLAKALAWTLVDSLWQGAAVAVALAIAFCLLRSPRARYAASCLALAALLAGFTATLAYLWPAPAAHAGPHAMLPLAPLIDRSPGEAAQSAPFRLGDLLPWLAPVWIAGVIVLQLRALFGWMAARRLRRSGVCCVAAYWSQRLDDIAARIRLSRPVALLESSLADAPVVIGYLRPVILMPVGLLAGLPAAQAEAILAHELAHVLRQDYLVNLMQTFVEGLLFYHPAVWWISRAIRNERENCCDDIAVAVSGDARQYAAALAQLEQNRAAAHELAPAATGGSLVNRIRRILETSEGSRVAFAPPALAIALAFATAAGLAAWQPASAPAPAPQPEPQAAAAATAPAAAVADAQDPQNEALQKLAQQLREETQANQGRASGALSTPYRKWLNEDVAYIITAQERAAFLALTTDEQREAFIVDFWQKRDPTPGTPENEFKEEHYRRIAYANEHFSSDIPGWKTDRGRIYIVYGPPDEIDDHSSGGLYRRPPEEGGDQVVTYPFQQWRYRYIEGAGANVVMEFVDPDRKNEYRMTSDPAQKVLSNSAETSAQAQEKLSFWIARAQSQPPAASSRAASFNGNSFVSVGGDPLVTVETGAGGAVKVNIEQNSMEGRWDYLLQVVSGNAVVDSARDYEKIAKDPAGGRLKYNCTFHLNPGSYAVNVAVKDPAGAIATKSVSFYVN